MKTALAGALVALALAAPPLAAAALTEPPAPAGTVEYNEWLGRTFSEVLLNEPDQAARVAILERIVAEDYIQHNPLVPEGRQGLIDFLPVIYQAMPDAKFVLHDVFATEDRVVTRWSWTGTLTGDGFLGVRARRPSESSSTSIDVWRVRGRHAPGALGPVRLAARLRPARRRGPARAVLRRGGGTLRPLTTTAPRRVRAAAAAPAPRRARRVRAIPQRRLPAAIARHICRPPRRRRADADQDPRRPARPRRAASRGRAGHVRGDGAAPGHPAAADRPLEPDAEEGPDRDPVRAADRGDAAADRPHADPHDRAPVQDHLGGAPRGVLPHLRRGPGLASSTG